MGNDGCPPAALQGSRGILRPPEEVLSLVVGKQDYHLWILNSSLTEDVRPGGWLSRETLHKHRHWSWTSSICINTQHGHVPQADPRAPWPHSLAEPVTFGFSGCSHTDVHLPTRVNIGKADQSLCRRFWEDFPSWIQILIWTGILESM